jgi:hypothetical protein
MDYFSDNLTKVKQFFYDSNTQTHISDENDGGPQQTTEGLSDEPPKRKKTVNIPFWSENPNILFQREYSMEFFPIDSMTYEQKLNAITRTILVLTILGLIVSQSPRIIIVSAITIFAIFILHYYNQKEKEKDASKRAAADNKENFENPTMDYLSEQNINIPSDLFSPPDSGNPFSNVLISDYEYNPEKKPAMPAFNSNVNAEILKQAKQLVAEANPDQPDISDKLFKDLGEQLVFEQSLRNFNSNPSTTIPNDQGAFADFCYGSMVSCKEGNSFACARNLSRYTN